METPETEQPPSLPQPEASVDITIDSEVAEEESNVVANGGLLTPSSSPAVTPTPSSVPTPCSGTQDRTSTGGNTETVSAYLNGGIINNRYSYSGSMASESMDMSISKENISLSAKVSQHEVHRLRFLLVSI